MSGHHVHHLSVCFPAPASPEESCLCGQGEELQCTAWPHQVTSALSLQLQSPLGKESGELQFPTYKYKYGHNQNSFWIYWIYTYYSSGRLP